MKKHFNNILKLNNIFNLRVLIVELILSICIVAWIVSALQKGFVMQIQFSDDQANNGALKAYYLENDEQVFSEERQASDEIQYNKNNKATVNLPLSKKTSMDGLFRLNLNTGSETVIDQIRFKRGGFTVLSISGDQLSDMVSGAINMQCKVDDKSLVCTELVAGQGKELYFDCGVVDIGKRYYVSQALTVFITAILITLLLQLLAWVYRSFLKEVYKQHKKIILETCGIAVILAGLFLINSGYKMNITTVSSEAGKGMLQVYFRDIKQQLYNESNTAVKYYETEGQAESRLLFDLSSHTKMNGHIRVDLIVDRPVLLKDIYIAYNQYKLVQLPSDEIMNHLESITGAKFDQTEQGMLLTPDQPNGQISPMDRSVYC